MTVHAEPVMGTTVSFDVRHDGLWPTATMADAIGWLHEVDRRFSPYRLDSEVSRIAVGELAERDAHADVRSILAVADAIAVSSAGAFDVRRWRRDGRLDPSGIVKGWSIEVAAERLKAGGVTRFAINAGGDVIVHGSPDSEQAWRVGIRHPDRPDRVAAVLAIHDLAVATSAAYERGGHIRDPHTGRVPQDVRSMTVVGPSLALADAYATTAYVLGLTGLDWVAGHDGYAALAISWDDRVRWTAGLDPLLARRSASAA